VRRIRKKIEKG
jgi:hypothetical protein